MHQSKRRMTVKEARKKLGKRSDTLSDTQVLDIITTLTVLAGFYFSNSGSNKLPGMIRSKRKVDTWKK